MRKVRGIAITNHNSSLKSEHPTYTSILCPNVGVDWAEYIFENDNVVAGIQSMRKDDAPSLVTAESFKVLLNASKIKALWACLRIACLVLDEQQSPCFLSSVSILC